MTATAPADAPPTRRARWLAALTILAVLLGGITVVALTRSRAAATRTQNAHRTIRAALETQGAALLRGDEPGWLRAVDRPLLPQMQRLYANLRGFEISTWLPRTTPPNGGGLLWTTRTQIRVCFAGAPCRRGPDSYVPPDEVITATTHWRLTGGRAVLTGWDQAAAAETVPWKRAALEFAAGPRTVIAARRDGTHPALWLAAAEKAARAADRFTLAARKPGKYLIYLATPADWNAAIGEHREAVGFVDRTSEQTAFAVFDASSRPDERLLAHELGHIATLLGTLRERETWAIEGLAEYIAYGEMPVSTYPRLPHARRIAWTGRLDMDWSAAGMERAGLYAMGYLAIRCLATTYGEPRLRIFVTELLHRAGPADRSAMTAFGASWERVQETCRPTIQRWLTTTA